MKRGEFQRFLDEAQERAALAGRQWWAQRGIDTAMSGADERDTTAPFWARYTWMTARVVIPLIPEQTFPLSAHWWHG